MNKKQIIILSLLTMSLFVVPSVYSKNENNPFNELWDAVNILAERVILLEEAGAPDLTALEARIEALEADNELLNQEIEALKNAFNVNLPPVIEILEFGSEIGWTVTDPEGDEWTGHIGIDDLAYGISSYDDPTIYWYQISEWNNVWIQVTDEHGASTSWGIYESQH